jgi:hypothetical protein
MDRFRRMQPVPEQILVRVAADKGRHVWRDYGSVTFVSPYAEGLPTSDAIDA